MPHSTYSAATSAATADHYRTTYQNDFDHAGTTLMRTRAHTHLHTYTHIHAGSSPFATHFGHDFLLVLRRDGQEAGGSSTLASGGMPEANPCAHLFAVCCGASVDRAHARTGYAAGHYRDNGAAASTHDDDIHRANQLRQEQYGREQERARDDAPRSAYAPPRSAHGKPTCHRRLDYSVVCACYAV